MTDTREQKPAEGTGKLEATTAGRPSAVGASLQDRHIPALDGLRALFVIAVVAYHLGYPWARGGFLGVDAFFVLSGYLITRLLTEEHERSGQFDVARFWLRRIRRLLPALLVMLVAVALASALWTDATQYGALRGDAFSGLFYVANWRFIVSGQSYFDLFAAPSPLRHLWSLAIEEQFYLVWPVVLVACFHVAGRRPNAEQRGRRITLGICVTGIVASTALMARWYIPGDPSRVYYGTETRAQTILVGCALAMILEGRRTRADQPRHLLRAAALAFAGMLAAFVVVHDTSWWLYRGGSLGFAVLVGCVLWYVTTRRSLIERCLSVKPLVALGRISYGLYLWHWPVIVFITASNMGFGGWSLDVTRVVVMFSFAVLSHRFVELPLRRRALRPAIVWSLAGVLVVAGLFIGVTAGAQPVPNYLGGDADPNGRCAEASPGWLRQAQAYYDSSAKGAVDNTRLRGKRILVVGDSTACSLVVGFEAVGKAYGTTIGNGTVVGCGVVSELVAGPVTAGMRSCRSKALQAEADAFAATRPDIVVWSSEWERVSLVKGGRILATGSPEWTTELDARILAAVHRFQASGAHVVFLTQPPHAPHRSVPSLASDASFVRYNALLRDFVARHPHGVTLIDLANRVCPGGPPCSATVDAMNPRYDGVHYQSSGAVWVAEWLFPQLAR